ncbi:MAG: hypothetical protein LBW77_00595 [Verrucomicrobiota bacterium]|jgi:hypothetical protein|nr:hypothetical protein [Verrucomicrobiota bacterium]
MNAGRWLAGALLAAAAGAAELPCEVSWVGNDWGGNPDWVPQDVDDLFVTQWNGLYTNVGWEEGGGNVMRFGRDGAWLGAAMHTHGWGYGGGEAVAANGKYVFIAQRAENERGHLVDAETWPPAGKQWWGVSRRPLGDFRKGAPFEGGKGGKGDTLKQSFKVVAERPEGESETIRGLWATGAELFVAVRNEGVIRVYDTETMAEKRSWRVARPDRMTRRAEREAGRVSVTPEVLNEWRAEDARATLWVLLAPEDEDTGAWAVAGFDTNGTERVRMAFPVAVRPTDVAVDGEGRLLVSDAGVSQQILIFEHKDGQIVPCGTFGERHGIFGGPVSGRVGERRFNRPRGVGYDGNNNLYVANGGGPGGGGTVLESYAPDGALRWRRHGLFFVDLPDLDAAGGQAIYSKEERFTLDLSRPAGQQTAYAAYTINPWKYPDDPRIHIWSANAWFQPVQGRPLLFVSNMGQDVLQVFRFNPETDGETAIPAALFSKNPKVRTQTKAGWPRGAPAEGAWLWSDRNGDGAIQPDEYRAVAQAGGGCVFIDDAATVWRVFKGEALGAAFKGFADHGVPEWQWDAPRAVPRPPEVSELRRFKVDPDRDIAAFGGDSGADKHQHWKPMGPAVAVYRDVLKGAPVKLWSAVLPYGTGSHGHESAEPMSFEIAGDYLFVCYTRGLKEDGVKWAFVKVYGLLDGRFVGDLVPERATGELGLLDLEDSLRARKLRDGSYLLFLEDDYKAKSVMLRWRPQ